jgi:dTDP-4-dehydrorhamnose reductase
LRIIVIGADGQLGSDLMRALDSRETIGLLHSDIEVSDAESVERAINKYKPYLVINTAAFHNVPQCEKDDLKSFMVNALGPKYLAISCRKYNCRLLHISTDYVFDGRKGAPYVENDPPAPLNVYGISKLMGEYYIKSIMDKYFIVRTSGLYGIHRCKAKGGNFIDTMLRLAKEKDEIKVVSDEILTPTYTLDLAQQIKELINTDYFGLYHITNEGCCSWFEFASCIFEFLNMEVNLKKTTVSEFGSPVRRPTYSVLENNRLKELKINNMRHWRDALRSYLEERRAQA